MEIEHLSDPQFPPGCNFLAANMVLTADYFHRLATSKIGRGEEAAANNRGTFYDVQAVFLALSIGHPNYAREKLLATRQQRIAREIETNGCRANHWLRPIALRRLQDHLNAK